MPEIRKIVVQGPGVVCNQLDLYYPSALPLLEDSFASGFVGMEVRVRGHSLPQPC